MKRNRAATAGKQLRRSLSNDRSLAVADKEHRAVIQRVLEREAETYRIRDVRPDDARRLIHIDSVVGDLWRARDRGEDVRARIDALFHAATGHDNDELADRRSVIVAIARVAKDSDEEIARRWSEPAPALPIDELLCELVCVSLHGRERLHAIGKRLAKHPKAVALAVRQWRRKAGRSKRDAQPVLKWDAIAEVMRLGGMGVVAASTIEQTWKTRRKSGSEIP